MMFLEKFRACEKKSKVFICSDMEGIAETTSWHHCYPNTVIGRKYAKIMTDEVLQLCSVLGRKFEIVIRDSHGDAKNIIPNKIKKNVELIQHLNNDPLYMMLGMDRSFDCCIFHGFHAADGSGGSPLAHTFLANEFVEFKLNGVLSGEGTFALYTAAYFGVPLIYMSGDAYAVQEIKRLSPNTITTITKDFEANRILCAREVLKHIKSDLSAAKEQFKHAPDICSIDLPKSFHLELTYRDPAHALLSAKVIPNLKLVGDATIEYQTDDYYDLLVAIHKLQRSTRMKYGHWNKAV